MNRVLGSVERIAADPNVMCASAGEVDRKLQFGARPAGSQIRAVIGQCFHVTGAAKSAD